MSETYVAMTPDLLDRVSAIETASYPPDEPASRQTLDFRMRKAGDYFLVAQDGAGEVSPPSTHIHRYAPSPFPKIYFVLRANAVWHSRVPETLGGLRRDGGVALALVSSIALECHVR